MVTICQTSPLKFQPGIFAASHTPLSSHVSSLSLLCDEIKGKLPKKSIRVISGQVWRPRVRARIDTV